MTGRLRFACASADEALHWVRARVPRRALSRGAVHVPDAPALDERSKNAQLPQTPSKCLVNAATLRLGGARRFGRDVRACGVQRRGRRRPHARPLRESAGLSRPPSEARPRVASRRRSTATPRCARRGSRPAGPGPSASRPPLRRRPFPRGRRRKGGTSKPTPGRCTAWRGLCVDLHESKAAVRPRRSSGCIPRMRLVVREAPLDCAFMTQWLTSASFADG